MRLLRNWLIPLSFIFFAHPAFSTQTILTPSDFVNHAEVLSDILPGTWEGKVHIVQFITSGNNYQFYIGYDLDMIVKIGDTQNPFSFIGDGTVTYQPDILKVLWHQKIGSSEPTVTLKNAASGVIHLHGTFEPSLGYFYIDDKKSFFTPAVCTYKDAYIVEDRKLNPTMSWTVSAVQTDRITIRSSKSITDLMSHDNLESVVMQGELTRTIPIGNMLLAFAAYLILLLPGLIMNPKSSDFLSLAGTLVGSLEIGKVANLTSLSKFGRLAGFGGAAVAEGIELGRIYMQSTAANESGSITGARLAISVIPDVLAFEASIVAMEAFVGLAAATAPVIGTVGAVAVGVGGAAAITYGISSVTSTAKTWATGVFNNLIAK